MIDGKSDSSSVINNDLITNGDQAIENDRGLANKPGSIYTHKKILLTTIITSFIIKIILSLVLTVHGDEGMYLYDASLILKGQTPHIDYYTRSPMYLYILSAFLFIFGETIFAGRLCSVIASTITSIFIYKIGKELYNEKVGLYSLLFFSFSPFTLMWSVLMITEIIQLTFVTGAFYLFIKAFRNDQSWVWYLICGALLGVTVFIRRTSLIVLLVILLITLVKLHGQTSSIMKLLKKGTRIVFPLFTGLIIGMLPFFMIMVISKDLNYAISSFFTSAGWGGTGKGSKFSVFQDLMDHAFYLIILIIIFFFTFIRGVIDKLIPGKMHDIDLSQLTSLSLVFGISLFVLVIFTNWTIIFGVFLFALMIMFIANPTARSIVISSKREIEFNADYENNAMILAGFIILGCVLFLITDMTEIDMLSSFIIIVALFSLFFMYLKVLSNWKNKYIVLVLFYLVLLAVLFLNPGYIRVAQIFTITFIIALIYYFLASGFEISHKKRMMSSFSIFIWFISILVFYLFYNMSQELFYYELASSACLIAGMVTYYIRVHPIPNSFWRTCFFALIGLSLITSGYNYAEIERDTTITKPWTIIEVAQYIRDRTESDEEIFTASMAIAVEADRPIIMNISHPTVYCDDYVGGFPDFDLIDYPDVEELINYLHDNRIRYIVNDPLTNYYYFMFNENLEHYVSENYILVKEINNVKILERSQGGDYRISSSLSNATSPTIISVSERNPIIGYSQGDYNFEDLFYRQLADNGAETAANQITPVKESHSMDITGISDSDGNTYFVWSEYTTSYSNIYFSKYGAEGKLLIPPTQITSSTEMGSYTKHPDIIIDSRDYIYLFWTWAPEREGYYDIYYIIMQTNGTVLLESQPLTYDLGINHNITLEIDGDDNIHAVWQDGSAGIYKIIYSRYVYHNGEENLTLLGESIILSGRDEAKNPEISISDNTIDVVWESHNKRYGEITTSLNYCQLNLDGDIIIPEKQLTYRYPDKIHKKNQLTVEVGAPAISSNGDIVVITWQDNRWESVSDLIFWNTYRDRCDHENRYFNIYYKILDKNGNVITNDTRISYYESNSMTPDVLLQPGKIHIVWSDDVTGNIQVLHTAIDI